MPRRTPSRRHRFPLFAAPLGLLAVVTFALTIRSRTHCDRLSIANMGFFLDQDITGFSVYGVRSVQTLEDGRIYYEYNGHFGNDANEQGHSTWIHPPGWYWLWWKWGPDEVSRFTVMVPAWPVPLFFTVAATLLLTSWAVRLRADHCLSCGYDFHTLPPELPCPECGQPRLKTPSIPLS